MVNLALGGLADADDIKRKQKQRKVVRKRWSRPIDDLFIGCLVCDMLPSSGRLFIRKHMILTPLC